MSKECVILVGMPGSGKSSWVDSLGHPMSDWVVLSTDNIVEEIAYNYDFTYSEVWKDAISLATKLYNRDMDECLLEGWPVMVDRTNLTIASRKKIIDKFKSNGYKIIVKVFNTPEQEEWTKRLNSRKDKQIPEEQLKAMLERYEKPTLDEGIDEISYA